ncbi:MAG: HAMP domain-containing histidine kinase [Halieaceae bacterium]|jgi:two-component system, sensor histidine kinase RegB|nr:HAMP domain-containing histidine kinase [Halieaceae bacterium]
MRRAPAYRTSTRILRSLLLIRGLALMGQAAVVAYVFSLKTAGLAIGGIAVSLTGLALITAISFWRLTREWPVTDIEFVIQLLIDVCGWTLLMYFCGGASNPFISYYLVPLVISAAVLPWTYTWLITGVSLVGYSLLLVYYVPLPLFTPLGGMHDGAFNTHVLGMWFNFIVSAGLITIFVVRMAAALRQRDTAAAEQREDTLRNDQILAVAGIAAGTAHELATPLSTMTVLVEDLLQDRQLSPEQHGDCELLDEQLKRCKAILQKLSRTAELSETGQTTTMPLDDYLQDVLARWHLIRPLATFTVTVRGPGSAPLLEFEPSLNQALENLLNNAANAAPEGIEVVLDWNESWLIVSVADQGPGVPLAIMEQVGRPQLQASESGLGLGLLLSHATVNRYGGTIELHNRAQGGAVATLKLPRLSVQGP